MTIDELTAAYGKQHRNCRARLEEVLAALPEDDQPVAYIGSGMWQGVQTQRKVIQILSDSADTVPLSAVTGVEYISGGLFSDGEVQVSCRTPAGEHDGLRFPFKTKYSRQAKAFAESVKQEGLRAHLAT